MSPGSVHGSAVKTSVSKVLPPYMVPSLVLSMDFIPTTLSGKVDQHVLLSLLVEDKATHRSDGIYSSHGQHMVPNSPLEEAVLVIYRKELQNEGIGMASDFFECGGDSLKAVRIVTYLRALHEDHPEFQIGKGFSALLSTDILQNHTPRALLQSCLGSSLDMQPFTPEKSIVPRPTEMRLQAPASFQQTNIYIAEQAQESFARADYNQLITFGASGKLDVEVMKMAFAFLWRRHQVLRTLLILQDTTTDDDGRLVQKILPPEEPGGTVPLEVWDCSSGWNSRGFGSAANFIAAIIELTAKPFDLGVQMAQSFLVKLPNETGAPNLYSIIISVHHAIVDGLSARIIVRELLAAYCEYAAGAEEPAGLPHLPLEYADYATWQWQYLEMEGHLEQQLKYWTKQLANVPMPLNLPFDRPRLVTSSGREGSRLFVFLPGNLMASLVDLCAQHRTTVFVGLMAAFQLMLSRLAGNVEDLYVGTPTAGRDTVQLQEVVGCIMETLAIHGELKGNPSFSTLLERQRLVLADALQHADVSLSKILQRIQVPRVANCNPVYQVVLNYVDDTDNFHVELADMSSSDLEFMSSLELDIMQQVEELSALELKHITLPEQKMTRAYETMNKATEGLSPLQNQDINLTLYRPTDIKILQADGLQGIMAYNSKLFDRSTAVMMFECFENLLVMAVENPHKVVWDLPML
ncbi:MAG: hypothetical protein GY696_20980, partial [Gammaproteobacteria bacterium]|nr:hypothetical protein [Gammaproteobacteria bacterium]